jgi:predicted transcriptional regulator
MHPSTVELRKMPNSLTNRGQTSQAEQKSNRNIIKSKILSNKVAQSSVKKRRILGALRKGPKSSSVLADEIRDAKGYSVMSTRKVWFHLRDLKELGLVENDEEGIYSLTLEGIQLCDKEL